MLILLIFPASRPRQAVRPACSRNAPLARAKIYGTSACPRRHRDLHARPGLARAKKRSCPEKISTSIFLTTHLTKRTPNISTISTISTSLSEQYDEQRRNSGAADAPCRYASDNGGSRCRRCLPIPIVERPCHAISICQSCRP